MLIRFLKFNFPSVPVEHSKFIRATIQYVNAHSYVCLSAKTAAPTPSPTPRPTPAPVTPNPTPNPTPRATPAATAGPKPKPSASGDPHFTTWGGKKYDFHGGCDLVLVQNPGFASGLGMNIHIRTSIKTWWSFIESAVVQIGANTLQITGGTGTFSINGGDNVNVEKGDASLGDFPVHFNRINDHQTAARIDLGSIGKSDGISIETFKSFVRVNIADKSKKSFVGSHGMLGAYPGGEMIGRDGRTVFEDVNEYGQEWMVKASDMILFHDTDASQLSPKCPMPNDDAKKEEGRRRLAESSITEEEAALACARVSDFDRDACIFDVMATGDKDMVGSY